MRTCCSSDERPERIMKRVQNLCQFAIEEFVEALEASALSFEKKIVIVQHLSVYDDIGSGLRRDLVEPLPLWRRPGFRRENALERLIHAFIIGYE